MNMSLTPARRLSIYIREEQPKLLAKISEEIINKLMLRLEINKQCEQSEIKIVWTFATMYCIITRDLLLFKRMFRNVAHARVMFEHAINYALNISNDRVINEILAEQYKNYFDKNSLHITINNVILAQNIVEDWLLSQQYLVAVDAIAKNYIDTF